MKHGFTLIEIMVVIVVLGVLAGIGAPKLIEYTEKVKEKADMMKLYYLRDALNRALVHDADALYKSSSMNSSLQSGLSNALKDANGASLFVMQLYAGNKVNIQGHANGGSSLSEILGTGGTWVDALNEAGFDGVADIVRKRLGKNDYNSSTFTTSKNSEHSNWDITSPNNPIFKSRALTSPVKSQVDGNGQVNLNVKVQWTGQNEESRSVEVFITRNNGNWQNAFRGEAGVCFSTYGNAGCGK